jgi:hypothetical protein
MVSKSQVAVTLSVAMGAAHALVGAAPGSAHAVSTPHVLGSGFFCGGNHFNDFNSDAQEDFFAGGGFTRWVTTHHGHVFQFAGSDSGYGKVGLRLDLAGTTNAGKAVSWTWPGASSGGHVFWAEKSGTNAEITEYDLDDSSTSGGGFTNNNPNYTIRPDKGGRFLNVWIFGQFFYNETGSDRISGTQTISNVNVGGIAVTPNTHNTTFLDCTPYS